MRVNPRGWFDPKKRTINLSRSYTSLRPETSPRVRYVYRRERPHSIIDACLHKRLEGGRAVGQWLPLLEEIEADPFTLDVDKRMREKGVTRVTRSEYLELFYGTN